MLRINGVSQLACLLPGCMPVYKMLVYLRTLSCNTSVQKFKQVSARIALLSQPVCSAARD